MKKNSKADVRSFLCDISFCIECSEAFVNEISDHYQQICNFYQLDGKISHQTLDEIRNGVFYFSFRVEIVKTWESCHLSVVALRNVLSNDLELIRQFPYVDEVEFQFLILPSMLSS